MAQPPFRSDAIQIEGDGPGTRLIECAEDGSLLFTDPTAPGGVRLYELAGLQRAQHTLVVTPDGLAASKDAAGNPITTIQAALDAVPSTSGALEPWTILVASGNYFEDLILTRSHVTLLGLGGVGVYSAGNEHTIRIVQGSDSTPYRVRLQNLTIGNGNAGRACVSLSTAQFATGSVTVATNPNVGDTVTLNGVVLTAIAAGPVPAPGQFSLGTTAADTADNLSAAISDPVNALSIVRSSVIGNVINLRASQPGIAGNTVTLASSVPLILVISAPTLTGGVDSSSASQVASDVVEIIGCDLVATGVNGYQVLAQAVNNIRILGGSWSGSSSASFLDVRDCSSLQVRGVLDVQRLEVHYNSTSINLPAQLPSLFELWGIETVLPFNSSLVGGGELVVAQSKVGNTSLAGDRAFSFQDVMIGTLFVGGTAQALLRRCNRGALAGDPTASLNEDRMEGEAVFAANAFQVVLFGVPRPNTSYTVVLDQPIQPTSLADVPAVVLASKTSSQFEISFGSPQATSVRYVVFSQV